MSTEANPRPWRVKRSPIGSNTWIVSGETFVASASRHADAALIVDAVNEQDRLRDIVRRMLPLAETTVENIRALGTARFPFMEQIKSDRLRGDINREVANADYLLRVARDAIGEDKA